MSNWAKSSKTVTVERRSQYGIYAAGAWLNISKSATFKSDVFEVGKTYELDGATSPKGQYFIDSYRPGGPGAAQAAPQSAAAFNATVPGANAGTPVLTVAKPAVDYAKKEGERDARITILAIVKSVLESPALPLLVTDKASFQAFVETESRHLLEMVDRLTAERVGA